VLFTATLVFAALGLAGWGLTRQIDHLAEDLPGYRANIRTKIADVRLAGRGGAVEKLQETLEDIKTDLGTESPKGTVLRPVVVTSNPATGFSAFAWLGPVVGPLSTAGLVAAMVIFMLLERRDLRDRLIGLIGHGQLVTTTKALDEAGDRVSRQLLMQSLVSVLYGIVVFVGLYFLQVPYPLVWATLGAALRFIPYVGPVLGAGAPILVSLAALEGWTGPIDRPRLVRSPRTVHESRARIGAVCRGGRRVTGGAARVGHVLDVAVGAARVADGIAADRVSGRPRQARARPRVRRAADGRHAATGT
jgi:predicted PurR-regulated permease PerM